MVVWSVSVLATNALLPLPLCTFLLQEKQAEKAKASEAPPLTDTQLVWQKLQQERAQQERAQQPQQLQQPARQQHAGASATPVYTVTWQIRLTSLGNIPLPWATN